MNNLKVTTLSFCLFLCSFSFAQATWEPVSLLPNGAVPTKIFSDLLDSDIQYCLTTSGEGLFKTTDRGETWSNIGLIGVQLFDMTLTVGNFLIASSEGIYKSIDEGATWQLHTAGIEDQSLTSLSGGFGDYLAGTIGGGVFTSSDGEFWFPLGTGLEGKTIKEVKGFDFPGTFRFAVTNGWGVFRYNETTDIWEPVNNGNSVWDNPAITSDSECNLYMADPDQILTTPCVNIEWQFDWGVLQPRFLLATTEDDIYVASFGDGVWKKEFNAEVWIDFSDGIPEDDFGFKDVFHLSLGVDLTLWSIVRPLDPDLPGGVYRTTEPITGVYDISLEIPKTFVLEQNYPNPFNTSTKIKYSVPQSSNVVIRVFDMLANEVETLVDEKKSRGTYETNWNAENLPDGIYYYTLQTSNFNKSRKMILIK